MKKREVTATALRDQGGGLLQLRLGRAAQGHGLWAAFGLAFNAFLIFAANNNSATNILPPAYLDVALWLLPLAVGGMISADALSRKWVPYKGYRRSRHFVLTALAFALSWAGVAVTFVTLTGILPFSAPSWLMYPVSVGTISLSLISMADTWGGHGFRKVVSILAAASLPLLMLLWVYIGIDPKPIPGPGPLFISPLSLLAMFFYFVMALAAEISGSMLHIISSSTSAAEREILTASDVKLVQLRDSLGEL